MDVSDGLTADLAKLCRASGVAAQVSAHRLPIIPALSLHFPETNLQKALSGGEDYVLLFTAPPDTMDRVHRPNSRGRRHRKGYDRRARPGDRVGRERQKRYAQPVGMGPLPLDARLPSHNQRQRRRDPHHRAHHRRPRPTRRPFPAHRPSRRRQDLPHPGHRLGPGREGAAPQSYFRTTGPLQGTPHHPPRRPLPHRGNRRRPQPGVGGLPERRGRLHCGMGRSSAGTLRRTLPSRGNGPPP